MHRLKELSLAVLVFLGLIVAMIIGTTPEQVRDRERRVGHGRALVLAGVIVVSLGSLTMMALILRDMERHQLGFRTQMSLCVAAVFSSCFLLQTMFALFYARQYWQPATGQGNTAYTGGLDFADEPAPDYWDFLYFSFTLGMCYQTSDVQIQSRTLRRVALLQSVLAYFFYTIIERRSLLHFDARRNSRAPGSRTARGGGLPYVSYGAIHPWRL